MEEGTRILLCSHRSEQMKLNIPLVVDEFVRNIPQSHNGVDTYMVKWHLYKNSRGIFHFTLLAAEVYTIYVCDLLFKTITYGVEELLVTRHVLSK
jgi:hypothetical protein